MKNKPEYHVPPSRPLLKPLQPWVSILQAILGLGPIMLYIFLRTHMFDHVNLGITLFIFFIDALIFPFMTLVMMRYGRWWQTFISLAVFSVGLWLLYIN